MNAEIALPRPPICGHINNDRTVQLITAAGVIRVCVDCVPKYAEAGENIAREQRVIRTAR